MTGRLLLFLFSAYFYIQRVVVHDEVDVCVSSFLFLLLTDECYVRRGCMEANKVSVIDVS